MPWSTSEVTPEVFMLRLSWYLDEKLRLTSRQNLDLKSSRQTLRRYAAYHKEFDQAKDDQRVASGKNSRKKQYPDAPVKLLTLLQIVGALDIEFDRLVFALMRSTDEHSFRILMSCELQGFGLSPSSSEAREKALPARTVVTPIRRKQVA